jgi:hypothetical protein
MPKGTYNRNPKMVNTKGEFLNKEEMKLQKQRHLNHCGPASKSRKPCIFCYE